MTMTMTAPGSAAESSSPGRAPLSEVELALRQLRAIQAFNRCLRLAEQAAATPKTREMRMDAARRTEVLRRQHEALVARAHEQLHATGDVLRSTSPRRVVLAHRSPWFLDRVSGALRDRSIHVVARLDDGAKAVGLTVCEQPDLLLVEDNLAMLPGVEVVRQLRELCPETTIVAQCAYDDRVGALLDAGAVAVYTRQIPPADVAAAMFDLIA